MATTTPKQPVPSRHARASHRTTHERVTVTLPKGYLAPCCVGERASGVPPEVQAAVAQLQPVFEESRYTSGDVAEPIHADLITELDAQQAVRLAEEVRSWVQTLLQRPPGSVRGKTSC